MIKTLASCLFVIGLLAHSSVRCQPELDTTFNGSGKNVLGGAYFGAKDMIVQPDGKIVMVSSCGTVFGSHSFCGVRLFPDGSFDTAFGSFVGSPYRLAMPSDGIRNVRGVAIQADGKLVLVGSGPATIVMRWLPEGPMDTSFGTMGGTITTDVTPGADESGEGVVIQPDGKILVAGYTSSISNLQFVLRYTSDGMLDPSFGTGGLVRVTLPSVTSGRSIALQSDGKILVGGTAGGAYLITRLDPNGSPDTTWGGDGTVTLSNPSGQGDFAGIVSLAIQRDGRVLALGRRNVLFRLNTDGLPDISFDNDGWRSALTGAGINDAYDVTVSSGGRITVVGTQSGLGALPHDYRIARYQRDGSPDSHFSDDGFLDVDFGGADAAYTAAVDAMGRVLIAGTTGEGQVPNPFVPGVGSILRLKAPIVNVGIMGRVLDPTGRPVPYAILNVQVGGNTLTAISNPFGYYRFHDIPSGQTYTVSVRSKRFTFADRTVFVSDDITDFDFVPESLDSPGGK